MTTHSKIPFLDLVTPHVELENELTTVFRNALETAGFIGGAPVEKFEQEFARFCDAEYCIGVGSGTDALRFALAAAGVKERDIVITVPHTFIATTEAISQVGACPEFVDVDEATSTMDVAKLREYLEKQCQWNTATKKLISKRSQRPVTTIVPVHLYGQMADMDPILELAEHYHLIVIEDACQAHGAEYFSTRENRWRKAGSLGKAAAFSFYPGKNLGGCRTAGAITTGDKQIARKKYMILSQAKAKKYYHDIEGYNGRLDAIQAGILRIKLKHLGKWNQQRQENAERYNALMLPLTQTVVLPLQAPWAKSVYHLYVIRVHDRDELMSVLAKEGIGTGIHYPIPLHLQTAYSGLRYKEGDFPVTELLAKEIVSLPMYPNLTQNQQQAIVRQIEQFCATRSSVTVRQPVPLPADLQRRSGQ
jgi:dTDP-4-amino-4,6-dideoxygalactose transaminase